VIAMTLTDPAGLDGTPRAEVTEEGADAGLVALTIGPGAPTDGMTDGTTDGAALLDGLTDGAEWLEGTLGGRGVATPRAELVETAEDAG